jgi:hypothetical protein
VPLFPVPDDRRHPKADLHDAIQAGLLGIAGLEGAVATRWVLTVECALPDQHLGLITITGSASHSDITSWEQVGLLRTALERALRGAT